jgi:hypothetical protein
MTENNREKSESQTTGNPATEDKTPSYHAPTLTSYGPLAELVKNNPAVGSDGGTGDCQHI